MKIKVYVQYKSKERRRQEKNTVIFIQWEIFHEDAHEIRVALVEIS